MIRDYLVGAALMLALWLAVGWWNAPAYKACAKSHSQEFCYTVLK
jgi:hypothetical protein